MNEADDQQRELWFIFSPLQETWANLRIATFSKSLNGVDLVVIHNEIQPRVGMRVWEDIKDRERWFKVRRIEVPTKADVMAAMTVGRQ